MNACEARGGSEIIYRYEKLGGGGGGGAGAQLSASGPIRKAGGGLSTDGFEIGSMGCD